MSHVSENRSGERGLSMVEMTVVLFLMSIVGLLFFNLFTGTLKTTMMLESRNDLTTLGQRAVNDIRTELMQSRIVLQNNAVGQSYLAKFTLDSGTPVVANSRLPIANSTGDITPDAGGETFTGNSVAVVRQLNPFSSLIDHDNDASTPEITFLADVYQFQYYYLTERTGRDFDGSGRYLDLVLATSGEYADYFQLSGLSLDVASEVQTDLRAAGVLFAWNPGQPANTAFYRILNTGAKTWVPSHKPDLTAVRSLTPEFAGGRVTGSMTYSIAPQGSAVTSGNVPVSVMAQTTSSFPHGFETLIVGPSGSRKIFLRIAMMSEQLGSISGHANEVVVSSSDF